MLLMSEVAYIRREDLTFDVEGKRCVLMARVTKAKNDLRGLRPPAPARRSTVRISCAARCSLPGA